MPQGWQERTGQTLRIVLTDPDHRPHLVAGLVVCAAAALVIFLVGRSPVAGTSLGQTTGALKTETAVAPPVRAPEPLPRPTTPEPSSATADPDPPSTEVVEVLQPESRTEFVKGPGLSGEELAPGLILPPRGPTGGAGAAATGVRPDKPKAAPPSPSPLPPTRTEPAHPAASPAERGPLGTVSAPTSTQARPPAAPAGPVPPRAAPKKSGAEPSLPARPGNGDFDFGI
jgi:hypothetical protein